MEKFTSFDKQLKLELYLNDHDKEYKSDEYEKLIIILINVLRRKKTMKAVRNKLREYDISASFENAILKAINKEKKLILNNYDYKKVAKTTLGSLLLLEAVNGLTYRQAFNLRTDTIKRNALGFVKRVQDNVRRGTPIDLLLRTEIEKRNNSEEAFFDDLNKQYRSYVYNEVDQGLNIRGWISIAILDKRTSAICQSLHNQFYSIKDYKSRLELPDLPPRHPRCRSSIITVEEGYKVQDYVSQDLNTYFKRNPSDAIEMLGEEKYKIWKQSGVNASRLYNARKRKLYSNKELKRKFKDKLD